VTDRDPITGKFTVDAEVGRTVREKNPELVALLRKPPKAESRAAPAVKRQREATAGTPIQKGDAPVRSWNLHRNPRERTQ
jgi:hypothetical protein